MKNIFLRRIGSGRLRHGGYFAIEALRVEIGQKAWGHELSPAWTPLESGVGFAVDMQKEGNGR